MTRPVDTGSDNLPPVLHYHWRDTYESLQKLARTPGNPYDGHTLQRQINQMDRLYIKKPAAQTVHVDMGYRGHDYQGDKTVIVDKRRRGETVKRIWRWMKRRAAVEPTIGHLKSDHRLERNQLRGTLGDSINALLSAAAMNEASTISSRVGDRFL